jgi:hypothetical protein
MKRIFIILFLFILPFLSFGQSDTTETPVWDNQFFLGNRVIWGADKWKHTAEIQVRLDDDFRSLERWYIEGATSYMYSKHLEIVPDFRIAIKPNEIEYRPGFGVLIKNNLNRSQIVHQIKWQGDIGSEAWEFRNSIRYILFYNFKLNDNFFASAVGGVFYTWSNDFTGLQYVRVGSGISWIIDERHTLGLTYFVGGQQLSLSETVYQGVVFTQLTINISKGYDELPAQYISF